MNADKQNVDFLGIEPLQNSVGALIVDGKVRTDHKYAKNHNNHHAVFLRVGSRSISRRRTRFQGRQTAASAN
jgi:hypothetical protein